MEERSGIQINETFGWGLDTTNKYNQRRNVEDTIRSTSHESEKDVVELFHLLCVLSLIRLKLQALQSNHICKAGLLYLNQSLNYTQFPN